MSITQLTIPAEPTTQEVPVDLTELLGDFVNGGLDAGPTTVCAPADMMGEDASEPPATRPRRVIEVTGSGAIGSPIVPTPRPPPQMEFRAPIETHGLAAERLTAWVVVLAALAVLAAFYVVFYTTTLWPVLSVDSDPRGATIYIDGSPIPLEAPAQLKVRPNQPHFIEARLAGYRSRGLESPLNLRFLGTGAVALTLERERPQLVPRSH
jgi:hypothetical protein